MIVAKFDSNIMNKIPKCCKDCPFVYNHECYGDICSLTCTDFCGAAEKDNFDEETQRLINCPLIED